MLLKIPADDDAGFVLVTERGNSGCAQEVESRFFRRGLEPARRQDAEYVAVREQSDISVCIEGPVDDGAGTDRHLPDRLPARDAVAEEGPAGPVAVDVVGGAAFVIAIVPFAQVGLDLGDSAETGQFAGAPGALGEGW